MTLNAESYGQGKPYFINKDFYKSYQQYCILGDGVPIELLTELQGDWYFRVLGNWCFCGA